MISFYLDLIHIICENVNGAVNDLNEYTNKILKKFQQSADNDEKPKSPKILWSMTFNIPTCKKCDHASETPITGLHLTCGPHFELDYDQSIGEASDLFKKIYPNDEFLPRAPDPEEIIIGDDNETTNTQTIESNIDGGCKNEKADNNAKSLQEIIKENIADFVEQIENEEKCRADNSINEEKIDDNI